MKGSVARLVITDEAVLPCRRLFPLDLLPIRERPAPHRYLQHHGAPRTGMDIILRSIGQEMDLALGGGSVEQVFLSTTTPGLKAD